MNRLLVLLAIAVFARGQEFLPARTCAMCHSRIPHPGAAEPASIAPYPLWRTSVMAHAARDPYWRARVDYEMRTHPTAAKAIEQECLRCHDPARSAEGVTCTGCHRISPSGDYESRAVIYGPHADPFAMPMLHHTGMAPEESRHVLSAELCATCHTLRNEHGVNEQSPYLEWKASSYPAEGKTCISCHMPLLEQPQYVAHRPPGGWFPPTSPRSPFRQHWFRGANRQLLQTVDPDFRDEPSDLLRTAATLECTAARDGTRLAVKVQIANHAGHKLPTGYPGRRMWLEVDVRDARGNQVAHSDSTVFEASLAGDSLVDAKSFAKDTRLLPRGHQGGDGRTEERFLLSAPAGALRLRVSLLFQSVPPAEIDRLVPTASPGLRESLRSFRANSTPRLITAQELQLP